MQYPCGFDADGPDGLCSCCRRQGHMRPATPLLQAPPAPINASHAIPEDETTVEAGALAVYACDYGTITPLAQRSRVLQDQCRDRVRAAIRAMNKLRTP